MMIGSIHLTLHEWIAARRNRLLEELDRIEPDANDVKRLEVLWHKLKFVVLEGDPSAYFRIREMFNRYRQSDVSFDELKREVFVLFRSGLTTPLQESNIVNLLTHIWGYLKKHIREEDRPEALVLVDRLNAGHLDVAEETYQVFAALHERCGKENLLDPTLPLL